MDDETEWVKSSGLVVYGTRDKRHAIKRRRASSSSSQPRRTEEVRSRGSVKRAKGLVPAPFVDK